MFRIPALAGAIAVTFCYSTINAQDHMVEVIDEAPQSDEISAEVAKLLSDTGIRVKRGSTRTVCEIWPAKEWPLESGFKVTEERLYPFSPGQLIGVLHFSRRGNEFRDQQISSGWYTLRFGLQPIDGNHEGTSPTRDFLLLVAAEQDEFAENWKTEQLHEASAEAAGSSHPAMLCMQRPSEGDELAVHHDEQNDWWVLHMVGRGVEKGQKAVDVPVDLVVVGHAAE